MLPESWTLYPGVLKKYMNPVFVETGIHRGGGIAVALECGFQDIRSVDIMQDICEYTRRLYRDYPQVKIYQGDAGILLGEMIENVESAITFWLDSHDGHSSTLWRELAAVASHPIKTHTILIDDRDWWPTWKLDEAAIKKYLLDINPDYVFCYEPNKFKEDGIFVASLCNTSTPLDTNKQTSELTMNDSSIVTQKTSTESYSNEQVQSFLLPRVETVEFNR